MTSNLLTEEKAKPFIKWAGGKRSLLPILLENSPQNYNRYVEPFLGGGALFFALSPKIALLSDINNRLITTYQSVQTEVEDVIYLLQTHKDNHSKEYYLDIRKLISYEQSSSKVAAYFIYLNKTCFNGLHRVNKAGEFNVPMGKYKNPQILDITNLKNVSSALQSCTISCQDFSKIRPKIKDFFYLDPPYHKTFTSYTKEGFGEDKQIQLANLCHKISKKGAFFLASNSDTPFIRNLYKDYQIKEVKASRSISARGNQRGKENELLIRNY